MVTAACQVRDGLSIPSWAPGQGELADLLCACEADTGAVDAISQGLVAAGRDALGLTAVANNVQVRSLCFEVHCGPVKPLS